MTTLTPNYSLVKPERNDLVEINRDWNDNLDLADAALQKTLPYGMGFEMWNGTWESSIDTLNPIASWHILNSGGLLGTGQLGPRLTDGTLNASNWQWKFLKAGLYRVTIKTSLTAVTPGSITEGKIGVRLVRANTTHWPPGLYSVNSFESLDEERSCVHATAIVRIYDPADKPATDRTFSTDDTFEFNIMWDNDAAVSGQVNGQDTVLTIEEIRKFNG